MSGGPPARPPLRLGRYEPEPAVPPGLVDWGRVGPVQSLPAVVAALVGPNATQLNRLIARLTNGTGTAALPGLRLRLPPLPVPSLGTVALALTGVAVSGLDTWTDVQPLRPSGEHSVATDVAAAHFGLALRGTADVHLTDGGALRNADLCEEFEVSLAAPAFEFRSDIFLAVKEQAFGALSGSQFVGARGRARACACVCVCVCVTHDCLSALCCVGLLPSPARFNPQQGA